MTIVDQRQELFDRYVAGRMIPSGSTERIARRSENQLVPMSPTQQQVWLRCLRVKRCPSLGNESITIYRDGPLDVSTLGRVLREIVRRHEAWRTSLDVVNGTPAQLVAPVPAEIDFPFEDLSNCRSEELREAEAARLTSALACQPFDMQRGPLWRVLLLKTGGASYRIFIVAHQTIVDGVSALQILPAELASIYEAYSAGHPSLLPELPIQYGDFSVWQKLWLQGARRDAQVDYWRRQLGESISSLNWPPGLDEGARDSYRGVILPFALPKELRPKLEGLAHETKVTLYMVLLAGFAALLSRCTGQTNLLIGTLSPSGRKRLETQALLGYFLNPVPLRFALERNPTFLELLAQTRALVSDAIQHDDVPFEQVEEELQLDLRKAATVAFSLQPKTPLLPTGWDVTTMNAQSGGSRWHLYLEFMDREHELLGRAQFNPEVLTADDVETLVGDLGTLLRAAASSPERTIGEL